MNRRAAAAVAGAAALAMPVVLAVAWPPDPAPPGGGAGEAWSLIAAGADALYDAHFFDESSGFVCGTPGEISRTADGGRSWTASKSGAAGTYRAITFPIDDQAGYAACTDGTVAKTTDGGDSWSDVVVSATNGLYGVSFPAGASHGWACGANDSMYRTCDGGANWVQHKLPTSGSGETYNAVAFPVDATTGWAVGGWASVIKRTGEHMICGTYTGDGSDGRAISGLGFQPDVVIIKGDTAQPLQIRSSTMAGDSTKEVSLTAFATDRIQSLDSGGFTLGTHASVNGAATRYDYIAFKAEAAELAVGTYVGNGADDRDIAIGFDPDYVLVFGEGGPAYVAQRFSSTAGDVSFIGGGVGQANLIQATTAAGGGFQIGSNPYVNFNGATFHYIAWNAVAGKMAVGSYTGDGTDDRNISGLSFRPEWVTLKGVAAGNAVCHRPESVIGDSSCAYAAAAYGANGIQAIRDDGFQLGTTGVNTAAVVYSYAAFGGAWNLQATPATKPLWSIQMLDEQTGYVAGNNNTVLKTTNGGANWSAQVPGTANFHGICFPLDSTTGWVVGSSGAIYKTTNGGTNWTLQSSPTGKDFRFVTMLDEATGWVAGNVVVLRPRPPWMITGRYQGDGSDGRAITGLGFQPDVVIIHGYGEDPVIRTSTMAGDSSRPIDGSGSLAVATNIIESLDSDGFTVGSDARANVDGTRYFWTALRADAEVAVGSYTGTGADNRSITGLGFEPEFLMVAGSGDAAAAFRYGAMSGDATFRMNNTTSAANQIQDFSSDGFEVGTGSTVNQVGWTYHYVAIKPLATQIMTGSYTGNGVDGRSITGLGFRPEWVVVKGDTIEHGHHRMQSFGPRDASFQFRDVTDANCIQSIEADGFKVGSSDAVNDSLVTYYWMAMARNGLEQSERKREVVSSTEKDPKKYNHILQAP